MYSYGPGLRTKSGDGESRAIAARPFINGIGGARESSIDGLPFSRLLNPVVSKGALPGTPNSTLFPDLPSTSLLAYPATASPPIEESDENN